MRLLFGLLLLSTLSGCVSLYTNDEKLYDSGGNPPNFGIEVGVIIEF
jgi:hypothetical protein